MSRPPLGMVARVALVLAVALVLELLGNLALQGLQNREMVSDNDVRRIAVLLDRAQRLALTVQPPRRAEAMRKLAIDGVALNWVPRTVITDFSASSERLTAMKTRLAHAGVDLEPAALRLSLLPSDAAGRRDLVGALALADDSFVTFRVAPYIDAPPSPQAIVLLHLLLMGLVLGIALLMVSALVQPLRTLAAAADATGHGPVEHFPNRGPEEVRRVGRAFAAMQKRLLQAVDDHTQALVAVSHDLRTPIQRLRLRASLVDDAETREAITGDLAEMEHFIESTLAYIRSGENEAERLVDIAAMLSTIVDDAADLGHHIDYDGPDELSATTRPLALKRAVGNLIDNACRHGAQVCVSLSATPDALTITVDDDGPGIPPARRDEALLPFRRLDPSRVQASGGAGLGLPTVVRTAELLGGALELGVSEMGGLSARLSMPRGGNAGGTSR